MFGRKDKMLTRMERMLDGAVSGNYSEMEFDETRLSRLECRWKQYLDMNMLAERNLQKEKENIKRLVSDISHQTKTPMTNLKLYTALLEESIQMGGEESKQLALLAEIIHQTDRLNFLIQSLMKLSRLESDAVEVFPKRQPIALLLETAVAEVLPYAEQKQIRIQNNYEESGNAVYDLKWTKEALGNILENAVKYSEKNSTIEISITKYEVYAAIFIRDSGIGISEEELPKIFGRFYRSMEVQQEDGVGIGLYLAREILKKENAYIKAESVKGEGSTFIIYLLR